MSNSEILAFLSILDSEISKNENEKISLKKALEALKLKIAAEDKKLALLQSSYEGKDNTVSESVALIKNEQVQFTQREKQLMEMGGAKSAKHLGAENDRATLVIRDLEQRLVIERENLSKAETEYLNFEEYSSISKMQAALKSEETVRRIEQIERRKKILEAERLPKVSLLPPAIAPVYDRLRTKYPDPVTIIEDGSCATCYTNIPLRISNAVKTGDPEVCPGCHRYLLASLVIDIQPSTEEMI